MHQLLALPSCEGVRRPSHREGQVDAERRTPGRGCCELGNIFGSVAFGSRPPYPSGLRRCGTFPLASLGGQTGLAR